jgi:hypothetical protein
MALNIPLTQTSQYEKLCQTVEQIIGEKPLFEFSIFRMVGGHKDFVVDHPDLQSETPLLSGEVKFWTDYWRVSQHKVSTPTLINPTWKMLLPALQQLLKENNSGGIFLERLGRQHLDKEITHVELEFGS